MVDEEIYRRLPTLLIATVDKFAQMPWKGEVQMLFGQVNGVCDRHGFKSPEIEDSTSHPKSKFGLPATRSREHPPLRPPDLVIQDELHLISGPLGTLVGLYETAIDKLCTWEVGGEWRVAGGEKPASGNPATHPAPPATLLVRPKVGELDPDDESQWFEALDTANPRWWRDRKNIVDVDERELIQLDKIMPRTSKAADAA